MRSANAGYPNVVYTAQLSTRSANAEVIPASYCSNAG